MIWKLNIHIFPSPLESNQSKSENTLVFSGCNYIRVFLKVGKAFKYTLCLHYKLKHQKINKYLFCFQIAPKNIYIYIFWALILYLDVLGRVLILILQSRSSLKYPCSIKGLVQYTCLCLFGSFFVLFTYLSFKSGIVMPCLCASCYESMLHFQIHACFAQVQFLCIFEHVSSILICLCFLIHVIGMLGLISLTMFSLCLMFLFLVQLHLQCLFLSMFGCIFSHCCLCGCNNLFKII